MPGISIFLSSNIYKLYTKYIDYNDPINMEEVVFNNLFGHKHTRFEKKIHTKLN